MILIFVFDAALARLALPLKWRITFQVSGLVKDAECCGVGVISIRVSNQNICSATHLRFSANLRA